MNDSERFDLHGRELDHGAGRALLARRRARRRMQRRVGIGLGVLVLVTGAAIGMVLGVEGIASALGLRDERRLRLDPGGVVPPETADAGEALAASDHSVGAETAEEASGSRPIVLSGHGVLGWWDGDRWHDFQRAAGPLPYTPGARFTVIAPDGSTATATSGDAVHEEFCGPHIPLSPPLLDLPPGTTWDDEPVPAPLAVRADWDVVPRAAASMDRASDTYRAIVEEHLRDQGITGEPIVIEQLLRVDLDGDGEDEILIAAEHPEADVDQSQGAWPRAGWYSTVLLHHGEGNAATTIQLLTTVFTSDDNEYPSMENFRISVVADLNGDGRMEVVVKSRAFESSGTTVFEYGSEVRQVLQVGCGV